MISSEDFIGYYRYSLAGMRPAAMVRVRKGRHQAANHALGARHPASTTVSRGVAPSQSRPRLRRMTPVIARMG